VNGEQLIKAGQDTGKQSTGLINQAMQQGLNVLLGTVLERVDLSDLDVEKISGQLQSSKTKRRI